MIEQHPITPPHYLIEEWANMLAFNPERQWSYEKTFTEAAQWGADQELQACINFVYNNELCNPDFYKNLSKHRRPKPPSLKEQALEALDLLLRDPEKGELTSAPDTIRRALEALPND